jgi:hypothetical protein
MNEQWTQWKPIDGIAPGYNLESITDGIPGLFIRLHENMNKKKGLLVSFTYSAEAYRITDESFRGETFLALSQQYGNPFFSEWALFKVKNSEYVQWLSRESSGITNTWNFIHFVFLTQDSMLDVVTTYEPTITAWDLDKI